MKAVFYATAFFSVALVAGDSSGGGRVPPFDSEWVRSDASSVNLTVLNSTVLRWTRPHKPTVAMTFLPHTTSIAKPGDAFRLSFAWRSDGQNRCDSFDWQDGKTCSCGQKIKEKCEPGKGTPSCARTSVNCIEGTGDFRIALWDISGSTDRGPTDDFCRGAGGDELHSCMDKIGSHFREYQFRTMPHVSTVYAHPKDSEPGGFYAKSHWNKTFCDTRLPGHWGHTPSGVFPGFAAPRGQWVAMQLAVARVGRSTYNVSISMGAAKYQYEHTWADADAAYMPQSIGAVGIWFPNSRSYDYVDFAAARD